MAEQMKRKKCINCGLLINEKEETCPYCGFKQNTKKSRQLEKPTDFVDIEKVEEKNKEMKMPKKIRKGQNLHWVKHMLFFIIGCFGLGAISVIVSLVGLILNPAIATDEAALFEFSAYSTFITYAIIFIALMLVALKDIPVLFKGFLKGKTYLKGLIYFAIGLAIQVAYSYLIEAIVPGGAGTNLNQEAAESIINDFPILSIIIIGIIGPISEELTYRVGLFGWVNKKSRVWAYIISSVVFGLMHFSLDFTDLDALLIELLNLPQYIFMGLVFAYAYDHDGVEASMTAHMFTNLISIILTIVSNAN